MLSISALVPTVHNYSTVSAMVSCHSYLFPDIQAVIAVPVDSGHSGRPVLHLNGRVRVWCSVVWRSSMKRFILCVLIVNWLRR